MLNSAVEAINEKVKKESDFTKAIMQEMEKVIVGQRYLLERLLVGLLANGHILIEGVPGLAKTLSVRVLAESINTNFNGIPFVFLTSYSDTRTVQEAISKKPESYLIKPFTKSDLFIMLEIFKSKYLSLGSFY